MLARAGFGPLVIERGRDVVKRRHDIDIFKAGGELDETSNVQFGEGGAGAFSDGKLNTGISDYRCGVVLRDLYEAGAPEEILYDNKPHIGTDKLPGVVQNIREKIKLLGGEVLYETKLTDLIIEKNRSVSLNATVAKVSTGAIDIVPVAEVANLSQALIALKKEGYWVIGTSLKADRDYRSVDYDMPVVLVIGSEGEGMRRLVEGNCDILVKMPLENGMDSLNASVAAGVMLYRIYDSRFPVS